MFPGVDDRSMVPDASGPTIDASGAEIPALGLGTARMDGEECRRAVETALTVGYRHVDTAQMYDNEAAVGEAIEASDVPREEIFVVTKVNTDNMAAEDVRESTRDSLDRLRLDTVDLLLVHAPRDYVPLEETLGAMNGLQEEGLVEHVGVSNFSVSQLEDAIDASATPIVTNQVKYHPYHRQDDVLAFCIDEGICLTAYSPLARGDVVDDQRLAEIGEAHEKTAAQVALRWQLQQPYVATIPKASSREHVEANADVFDFELSPDEMRSVFDVGEPLSNGLADRMGM